MYLAQRAWGLRYHYRSVLGWRGRKEGKCIPGEQAVDNTFPHSECLYLPRKLSIIDRSDIFTLKTLNCVPIVYSLYVHVHS